MLSRLHAWLVRHAACGMDDVLLTRIGVPESAIDVAREVLETLKTDPLLPGADSQA